MAGGTKDGPDGMSSNLAKGWFIESEGGALLETL